jgi:hypothetical protein
MLRFFLIFFFIVLFLFPVPTPAEATEPDGLTMSVQAAFGGRFKFGEWLPIYVTVENAGSDLSGEIRAEVTNQTGQLNFVTPADMPAGARKRFTLYVLPNNYSRAIDVALVRDDEVLLTSEVSLTVLANDRYVLGIAAADATGLSTMNPPHLPGRRERSETMTVSLDEIPGRPEGLRLLDALILNDVDTTLLTPDQQTTLDHWVANGGRLILGGGAGARRTLTGLPPRLQPVTLIDIQEVPDLSGLAAYAQKPLRIPGPFVLARVQPQPDTIVRLDLSGPQGDENSSSADLPLVIELPVGAGHVDFIALDLTQSPFDTWAGVTEFTKRLLAPDAAWAEHLPPDVAPQQMSDSQISQALTNLPALDLPSVRFLGILLAGYILLVGPVNYLVLRWRDRLAWAWVTIPTLTLAFSALAFGLGFNQRGSDIIVNQISIIELGPAGQASRERTYVGIFSPRRRAYDIEIGARTLIRPLDERYNPWDNALNNSGVMSVVQGEPAQVRGLMVNQWSMQSFVAETMPAESLELSSELSVDRNSLHGHLKNLGTAAWQDVIVIFDNQFQKVGNLQPGQSAAVNLDLSRNSDMMGFGSYMLFQDEFSNPTGPDREVTFKQRVLDGVIFNNFRTDIGQGPFVIGWLEDSPLPIRIENNEIDTQKTSLIYGSLPFSFGGSQVIMPPGFSQMETLSLSGDTSPCHYGQQIRGYYVFQGTVEARLSLPSKLRNIQLKALDLYINTDPGWPTLPEVGLYDQIDGDWVALDQAQVGPNPIREIDRFYDPETASVQVRLSNIDNADFRGGGCLYLDLALEGERQ